MKNKSQRAKSALQLQAATASLAKTPEFVLSFVGQYGPDDTVEAQLSSNKLDTAMHPDGNVTVLFEDTKIEESKPKFLIDSFHIKSVAAYLGLQVQVRGILERELVQDHASWDPGSKPVRGPVWMRAKVESVDVRRRMVPTPELLKTWKQKMRLSPTEIRKALAQWDNAGTQNFFRVTLRCDWDEEHLLRAEFRDCKFLGLSHF